jgi:hypothetical protein
VRFEPAGLVPVLQELGDDVRHVLLDRRRAGKCRGSVGGSQGA